MNKSHITVIKNITFKDKLKPVNQSVKCHPKNISLISILINTDELMFSCVTVEKIEINIFPQPGIKPGPLDSKVLQSTTSL